MQAYIYLIGNLLLACITGLFFSNLMKQYELPTICKFFIGFSLHPYLIGIYMLLIAAIPIKMPNYIYVIIPYLMALFFLGTIRKNIRTTFLHIKNISEPKENDFADIIGVGLISSFFYGVAITESLNIIGFLVVLCSAVFLLFAYLKIMQRIFGILITKDDYIGDEICLLSVLFTNKLFFCPISNLFKMSVLLCFAILSWYICWKTIDVSKTQSHNKKALMRSFFILIFCFLWSLKQAPVVLLRQTFYYLGIPLLPLWTTVGAIFFLGLIIIAVIKMKSQFFAILLKETRFVIIFISLIVLIIIIRLIMIRGITIVSGSDAIQYLSEAYEYTREMRFGSMNDFHGNTAGSLLSNIHNPIWPAYLANGLLYAREIGYPFDYGARMAFSLSYIYMLGVVFALGYALKGYLVGLLGCLLLFSYKHFNSLILGSTRDGFRIIPLIIFCIILLSEPKHKNFTSICISVLVGFFLMAGHPINSITAFCIGIAYILWVSIASKGGFFSPVLNLFPFVIGACLGGYQIIWAYLETGSLTGGLIDFETILQGTSYYNTYMNNFEKSLGHNIGYFRRIIKLLIRFSGHIIIPALLCVVGKVLYFIKRKDNKSKELFIVLIILLQFLMLTDLLRWSGGTFTEWLLRNYRYSIQMYIFYVLIISFVIDDFLLFLPRIISSSLFFYVSTIFFLCCYISIPLFGLWPLQNEYPSESWQSRFDPIINIVNEIAPNKILLDDYNLNYYLKNKGISFWTKPVDPLRHASTDKDFYQEAKKINISAILITETNINIFWENTELEHFIASEYIDKTILIKNKDKTVYRLYTIKDLLDD